MPPADADLRPLDARDPRELEAFLALYREAIPVRERKPDAQVTREVGRPDRRAEVIVGDGAVIGLLLLYVGRAIALLEYMATAPDVRGRGLGARLYAHARTLAGSRPLLIEVESDEEAGPERELRARRLGFYRREGARVIDGLDYRLPLPGEGPPPRLKLLVDNWSGADVARGTVGDWLGQTYAGVYGVAPTDPRLDAMIHALGSRVRLL